MYKSLQTVLTILLLAISSISFSQENKKYSVDSLKSWTTSTLDEVSTKHPGFYRYTSKERFDFLIDSTISTINEPLTTLEYYRKIKPLFAQIGCLHTGISLSEEIQRNLDERPNLLPIEVFVDSAMHVYVSNNYVEPETIPVGSIIKSINEQSIEIILSRLMKSIPSDGFNTSLKIRLLSLRFAHWYRSIIEENDQFDIKYEYRGEDHFKTLTAVKIDVFPSQKELERDYVKSLEFQINRGTGVLTIHTFAKSVIKKYDQNFKKFTDNVFAELKEKEIENLILDLRGNTGGSDTHAVMLTSYFFEEPFKYWDRIEVTKAIAEEIKGTARIFYKKPILEDSIYLWQKIWLANDFDYYEVQKPADNNYDGKIYILTDGFCMSSCADVTAILAYNKKAVVIGQESGGGYQGNCSGLMPSTELPMGIIMTIPLQKYTNAVNPNVNVGRGTVPDYPVNYTFENWINKDDLEMKEALNLINQSN